ncbi:MAG: MaoC/PaaZ C-terminal domain-containing protein [Pseudomonadota bacterium]
MSPLYFDDLRVGQVIEAGSSVLDEAAIIDFAEKWDPQDFHTSAEAAKQSHFGGLVASGFHTLLTAFNHIVALPVFQNASMGSPGIQDLAWIEPVLPDDVLTTEIELMYLRPSTRRKDRGYAGLEIRTSRQRGTLVMRYRTVVIFATRPPGVGAG